MKSQKADLTKVDQCVAKQGIWNDPKRGASFFQRNRIPHAITWMIWQLVFFLGNLLEWLGGAWKFWFGGGERCHGKDWKLWPCMVIFYIHMIYYFVHLVGTGMYCRYREKGHQCLGADFLAAGFFSVPKDQLINWSTNTWKARINWSTNS